MSMTASFVTVSKLQEWADTNGFKFSTANTVCLHYCRLRKLHPDPQLSLNGSPIPVVEEAKFLGIIFDKKLSFLPHFHYSKNKCTKALNLLHVALNIMNMNVSSHQTSFLFVMLYKSVMHCEFLSCLHKEMHVSKAEIVPFLLDTLGSSSTSMSWWYLYTLLTHLLKLVLKCRLH